MDGQASVGGHPDIELDPVGAQLTGPDEGLEGVLADAGRRVGAAPVRLDGDRCHRRASLLVAAAGLAEIGAVEARIGAKTACNRRCR